MKKILLISPTQFGYHTDPFAYCQNLNKDFNITVICFDQKHIKLTLPDVKVIYIGLNKKKKWKHWLSYFATSIREIKNKKPDLIFMIYFRFCFLVKIISFRNNIILDIRTGNLYDNQIKQFFWNSLIGFESLFFKNITIITESLRKKLFINKSKVHILPLGADILDNSIKEFNELNLIYIGSLNNRQIEKTIEGLAAFVKFIGNKISVKYNIIGFGDCKTESILLDAIDNNELNDVVLFHGRILYTDLYKYLSKSNIGIAYVPLKNYYDCQPLTKLYEYLLSGMPVIATNSYENRLVVNKNNGTLIGETKDEFFLGLIRIYERKFMFDSEKIRLSVSGHTWENITLKNLKPYLEKNAR